MELCSFEQCTGCTACKSACPKGCITMQPDRYGFLYPTIDVATCVNCGKCRNVCPVINEKNRDDLQLAFAATHRSGKILKQSSSGGVFTALAKWCIDQGGVVYGAAFDHEIQVEHISVTKSDDLAKLRGAKYVQSNLKNVFCEIQELLIKEKLVLFSGTPCQTAGLVSYLGKDYSNLFLVDCICHSVPSPLIWKEYLKSIEYTANVMCRSILFRGKRYGWENYEVIISAGNGKEIREFGVENSYMQAYLSGLIVRDSCGSCHFKGCNHKSNLTIGDLWGCRSVSKEAYCEMGTSLVVAHDVKGIKLLDACKRDARVTPVDLEKAIQYNPAYQDHVKINSGKNQFFDTVISDGFVKAVQDFNSYFPVMQKERKLQIIKEYSPISVIKRKVVKIIMKR